MFIPYLSLSLNEYIKAERSTYRWKGSDIKRQETNTVAMLVKKYPKIDYKADVYFTWHLPDKKKDPDNIAFAQKFIFDGLMKAGLIENDGHKQINSIHHYYVWDKQIGVNVEFREVK